ncbi:MAG: hypothetical protein IKR81_18075 [Victivallales bacterium]|nr:hypothetical protein [Victivallales bacterium]
MEESIQCTAEIPKTATELTERILRSTSHRFTFGGQSDGTRRSSTLRKRIRAIRDSL